MTEEIRIPLMRPKFPEAETLLPYLEEIDRERWYTNSGALLTRFEARLEDHFGVPTGAIICVADLPPRFVPLTMLVCSGFV